MQEFTTTIKNLTKGLRPVNVPRDTGFLQDCLNLQPTAGDKLEQINYLQFPPVFIDTYTENRAPIAIEDFFFLYQNETLDGNVLYNDADWNAETFSVVSVNGEAGNVGIELTLDDGGATCTIEANGALHFVPGYIDQAFFSCVWLKSISVASSTSADLFSSVSAKYFRMFSIVVLPSANDCAAP